MLAMSSSRECVVRLSCLQANWLRGLLQDEMDRVNSMQPASRSELDKRDRRLAAAVLRKLTVPRPGKGSQ